MNNQAINTYREMFASRLNTLIHILDVSLDSFTDDPDSILGFQLVEDMLPLGTQIVYTCNQPNCLVQWASGQPIENFPPELGSISAAKDLIGSVKSQLREVQLDDALLKKTKRVEFGGGRYAEMTGEAYLNDFLIPNFYFHLTTTYNIMRMKGVPLGKANFMAYLLPIVKQD